MTAEKLGAEPYECLVFEDSKAGVGAVITAGMAVVGVARNKKGRKELLGAHKIISGFSDFRLSYDYDGELIN